MTTHPTLPGASPAQAFAALAHAGQRYGDRPYLDHLDAVVACLYTYKRPELAEAGYLHDVLEDCPAYAERLVREFPEEAPLVERVTGRGATRRERNADIYRKVAGDERAQTLKAADRLANMRASFGHGGFTPDARKAAMYCLEAAEFLAHVPLASHGMRARIAEMADLPVPPEGD